MEVIWEDPPASTRTSKYDEVLEQIRVNPGSWARVGVFDTSARSSQAALRLRKRAGAGWEFTAKRIPDTDTYGVWARYSVIDLTPEGDGDGS